MFNEISVPEWLFNLYDEKHGLARKLADGLNTRIFVGENIMLSVVKIEAQSEGKIHSHSEEQWGVLLVGECTRIQAGEEVNVKAGDFWYTPGNVLHGIRTGTSSAVVLDIFSPPRPEYKQSGEGFGPE
jgi:quercetin dioxygenase-like cupin family protein